MNKCVEAMAEKIEIIGGYKIVMTPRIDNRYDVVSFDKDGEIIFRSTGCRGEGSRDYWFKYQIDRCRKLTILEEDLEMAQNNMRCYGSNPGYQTKYDEQVARVLLLIEWINECRRY